MKKIGVLIFSLLIFSACADEDPEVFTNSSKPLFTTLSGIVQYTGDQSYDGCGWIIRGEGDVGLSGAKLPEAYKKEGISVEVTFKDLGVTSCGLNPHGLVEIEILKIVKNS